MRRAYAVLLALCITYTCNGGTNQQGTRGT